MIATSNLELYTRTWTRAALGSAFAGLLTLAPVHDGVKLGLLAVPFLAVAPQLTAFAVLRAILAAVAVIAAAWYDNSRALATPVGVVGALGILVCAHPSLHSRTGAGWIALGTAGLGAVMGAAITSFDASLFPRAWGAEWLKLIVASSAIGVAFGAATLPAHLVRPVSELDRRRAELLCALRGPLLKLGAETRALHEACVKALDALPSLPGQRALRNALDRIALDSLTVCAHWSSLDEKLAQVSRSEREAEVAALKASLCAAQDEVVQRQLSNQLRLCEEQLQQLDAFAQSRERAIGRVRSQLTLLERARLSLWMSTLGEVAQSLGDGERLARALEELSDARQHEAQARAHVSEAA